MNFEKRNLNSVERKEEMVDGLFLESHMPVKQRHKESIIFIHGSGMNYLSGSPVVKTFSQPDFGWPGYTFSLRGHSRSQIPENFTRRGLDMYYEDLEKVSDFIRKNKGLDNKDRILWGHSLGGLVAMEDVKHNSAKALILLGSALPKQLLLKLGIENVYPDQSKEELEHLKAEIEKNIIYKKPEEKVKKYFSDKLPDDFEKNYEKIYSQLMSQESNQVRLEITTNPPDVTAQDINCPVLVIAGHNDPAISVEDSKNLANFLNADFLETDSSHLAMYDDTWNKTAVEVKNWLEKIEK